MLAQMESEISRLEIDDIIDLQPIKLPNEAWRDHKKLTRFLTEVETTINKIINGVKQQTKNTAKELVLRPTYAEEFQHLRDNIGHRVPERDEFSEEDSVSAKSSVNRSRSYP